VTRAQAAAILCRLAARRGQSGVNAYGR